MTMGPYSVGVGVRDQKYQINPKWPSLSVSSHIIIIELRSLTDK